MTHETATLSIYALSEADIIDALIEQTACDGVMDHYTVDIVVRQPDPPAPKRDTALRVTWVLLAVSWVAILIQVFA